MFNIKSSRHQFSSQRWIFRWSFVEQLYQLRFLQNTSWFLKKNYFLSFPTKAIFLLLFLGQRRPLNITLRKWYLTETCNENLKIWTLVSSEVIPDSKKTIDDRYLHLPFLVPKYQFIVVLEKTCSEILLKYTGKHPQ